MRPLAGWTAILVSTAITCFWAMWGVIENFHEGWYHESVLQRLAMMFGQYLSPMIVFLGLALVSIRWPRVGGVAHLGLALFVAFFFTNSYSATTLIMSPLVALALLYFFGKVERKKRAVALLLACTALTFIGFGAEPVFRVAQRFDDGFRGARTTAHGERHLVWAPSGPGWPLVGTSWDEAADTCSRLELDGTTLSEEVLNIWRLPTPTEMVEAQHRHNEPCGGVFDAATNSATYRLRPDKEPPVWNPNSQVIYMWTSGVLDEERALMMCYDGKLWPRKRSANWGFLGFRAVREVPTVARPEPRTPQ